MGNLHHWEMGCPELHHFLHWHPYLPLHLLLLENLEADFYRQARGGRSLDWQVRSGCYNMAREDTEKYFGEVLDVDLLDMKSRIS